MLCSGLQNVTLHWKMHKLLLIMLFLHLSNKTAQCMRFILKTVLLSLIRTGFYAQRVV